MIFPSKLETIYDNVQGFCKSHLENCRNFPELKRVKYEALVRRSNRVGNKRRHTKEFLRAYYADTASDLGLVDTEHGLAFEGPKMSSVKDECKNLLKNLLGQLTGRSDLADGDEKDEKVCT